VQGCIFWIKSSGTSPQISTDVMGGWINKGEKSLIKDEESRGLGLKHTKGTKFKTEKVHKKSIPYSCIMIRGKRNHFRRG
jgi:hypothetical protein